MAVSLMRIKSEYGFSLMEILTVVAITGVLATIGATNFNTLQRKKKKAEAKYQLGVLHTRMTNFQLEWQEYYGRFRDIGYAPTGNLIYDIGFTAEGMGPASYIPVGTAGQINTRAACNTVNGMAVGMRDIINCSVDLAPNLSLMTTWTANMFTAGAEGEIGGMQTDQWTINEQKDLMINVRDGSL